MAKLQGVIVYCDINNAEFQTPSVIMGDDKRSDIVMKGKTCMILELMVGFETNLLKNSKRKFGNDKDLVKRLEVTYDVKYVDLSMGAIGVIGRDSKCLQDSFINM